MADRTDRAPNPHDRLVKRVLGRPEAAAVELRHVLPASVAAHLEWSTLRVEPSSFVDPRLRSRHSDIVYSVQVVGTGSRAWIHVVLEHQSSVEPLMPWRMLQYLCRIWDRHVRTQPEPVRTLPLVIPIVLAQCPHGWTGARRLSDLFDLPSALRSTFGATAELELVIDDLRDEITHDQHARDGIVALVEITRSLLLAFHRREWLTSDRLAALAPRFDVVMRSLGIEDVQSLWTYVVSAFEPTSPLRDGILRAVSRENRAVYATIKDEWIAEGRAEGEARGRAEGEAKGRAEGEARGRAEGEAKGRATAKAELVLTVLEHRGVTMPSALRRRVLDTTDELQLQRWFDRALSASSVDDVFTE